MQGERSKKKGATHLRSASHLKIRGDLLICQQEDCEDSGQNLSPVLRLQSVLEQRLLHQMHVFCPDAVFRIQAQLA